MNVRDEHVAHQPATSQEYRLAIAALNESTRAIESHLDASRKVLETSKRQLQLNTQAATNRTEPHGQRKQILRLIDTLRSDTHDKHRETTADLQKFVAAILIATDDTLARHDHEFSLLEKVHSSDLGLSSKARDERNSKLIGALKHCIAATIRTKLDRVYLEASYHDPNGLSKADAGTSAKLDNVQEDLRILHSEIDDVAQMLVTQQHANRLDASVRRLKASEAAYQDIKRQKTLQQIQAMDKQLDILLKRAELLQSHREIQKRIATHLDFPQATGTSRQQSPVRMESVASVRQTASLTALNQCLGLESSNNSDKTRSDRIDSMFIELKEHIEMSLTLRDHHLEHFRPHAMPGSGRMSILPSHAKLDELDTLIATMKSKMDNL